MDTTIATNYILLSLPVKGCLWALALFLLCFFGTHFLKLAKEGWRARNATTEPKKEEPPPKKEEPKKPSAQEPIYYIVEKKQRRKRPEYGEPKPIRFQ